MSQDLLFGQRVLSEKAAHKSAFQTDVKDDGFQWFKDKLPIRLITFTAPLILWIESFYLHLATSLSLFTQHKSDCSDQTVSCENNSFFSRWQGVNVSAGVVGVVTFLRRSTAAHVARADTSFIYARPTCGLDPKVFQTTLGGGVRYIYTCIKKIRIQTHSFVHWLHSYCSHRSKSRPLKMSVDVLWKRAIALQMRVTVVTPELMQRRTLFVFNRGNFLQHSFGSVPTQAYHLLHRWHAADAARVHAVLSASVLDLKRMSYSIGLKCSIHPHQRCESKKCLSVASQP